MTRYLAAATAMLLLGGQGAVGQCPTVFKAGMCNACSGGCVTKNDGVTSAPTRSPTKITKPPTRSPTKITKAPTRSPTKITKAPTRMPTKITKAPTRSPTTKPVPTQFPTRSPTTSPTKRPPTAPPCADLTVGKCDCECKHIFQARVALDQVPSLFMGLDLSPAKLTDKTYQAVIDDFHSMFSADFRTAGIKTFKSKYPYITDANDWDNLFGRVYVNSVCILPAGQKTSGPTVSDLRNREVCRTVARPLENNLKNAGATVRKAKTAATNCFTTGGMTACTVVFDFVVETAWRKGLPNTLTQVLPDLKAAVDVAGTYTAGSSGTFVSQWTQASLRSTQTGTVVPGAAAASAAGTLQPILLLSTAVVAFFSAL